MAPRKTKPAPRRINVRGHEWVDLGATALVVGIAAVWACTACSSYERRPYPRLDLPARAYHTHWNGEQGADEKCGLSSDPRKVLCHREPHHGQR